MSGFDSAANAARRQDGELFTSLSRSDWQGLYDHIGTMPWAPGSWSNNWRAALSEALARNLDEPVVCASCGEPWPCTVARAAEDTECPSSATEGLGSATCVARKEGTA